MKIHKDIKELLKEYDKYSKKCHDIGLTQSSINVRNFLTFNSLALGKPEPLAKNKQTDNKCECDAPIIRTSVNMDEYCCNCGQDLYHL